MQRYIKRDESLTILCSIGAIDSCLESCICSLRRGPAVARDPTETRPNAARVEGESADSWMMALTISIGRRRESEEGLRLILQEWWRSGRWKGRSETVSLRRIDYRLLPALSA